MIFLFFVIGMTIYSFVQLLNGYVSVPLEENLLMICNVICSVLLMIAAAYKLTIERSLSKEILATDEDLYLNNLEIKSYTASYYVQSAFVLSFMAFTIGFILFRDSNPNIVLAAFILGLLCFFAPGQKMMELTHPNFKLPDPKSKDPVADTLEYYDDGQKHLMLKSLYKLYFSIIGAFIFLILALMFYSIFSGNNQIVSIIGIGIILLFVLNTLSMSLKPQKISESSESKQVQDKKYI